MQKVNPTKANLTKANPIKIEALVKQLDLIKHIAESNYWVNTDELCQLLELDASIANSLKYKEPTFSFTWRNFICTYRSRQGTSQYWSITRHLSERGSSEEIRREEQSLSVIQPLISSAPQHNSVPQLQSSPQGILPSSFAQIDNFLPQQQLDQLYQYVLDQEPKFVPTSNSANDPDYRRSLYLPIFPEFSELMVRRIQSIIPGILTYLNLPSFVVDHIESQLTAHNDGNYYKIHNDSGSPDTLTRELTYVYYFHREPKPFSGGELLIYDSKIENNFYVAADSYYTVQPRNNSIVFFLSRYMHEVLTVNCPSRMFRDSRFTINGWVRRRVTN